MSSQNRTWHFVSGGGQFWARDVSRSIRWYSHVLTFAVDREYTREDGLVYVHLRCDRAWLLILDKANLESTGFVPPDLPIGDHEAVRIRVEGLDALLDDLITKVNNPKPEVELCGSKREIRMTDPDGWGVVCWEWA